MSYEIDYILLQRRKICLKEHTPRNKNAIYKAFMSTIKVKYDGTFVGIYSGGGRTKVIWFLQIYVVIINLDFVDYSVGSGRMRVSFVFT